MYPYMNEDVAFERLKDLQREMENSRLTASSLGAFGNLSARAWWLGGLALRRAPRRRPVLAPDARQTDAASDAA